VNYDECQLTTVWCRCVRAVAAALSEARLHQLLQLALLPAAGFALPAAAAVLGADAAPERARRPARTGGGRAGGGGSVNLVLNAKYPCGAALLGVH